MTTAKADKKRGGQAHNEAYKKKTPVLVRRFVSTTAALGLGALVVAGDVGGWTSVELWGVVLQN